MLNRRHFIKGGLSAVCLGLSPRRALGLVSFDSPGSAGRPLLQSRPFATVPLHPTSIIVDQLPFADWFTGDSYPNDNIPFHSIPPLPDGPPPPEEDVEVAIIGGGISGLSTALLLRQFRPVLFELTPRFGGNARGEIWGGAPFSLGGAYFITPDEGSFLDRFYRRLGLDRVARVDAGDSPVELGGKIVDGFWDGAGQPPEIALAFKRYAEIVRYYADESYPEIPLPEGKDNQWIIDLDNKTLREDIEEKMNGIPIPPLLAAAIQGYCYSSFGIGWDNLSAAGGWNFIAAEEFGRWVLPGGNAFMVDAMWRKLLALERRNRPPLLRPGCQVFDVRVVSGDRVQVTYLDPAGITRSLRARRVVMANGKHIAKYMIHELGDRDPAKREAMQNIDTMAYVVANVLLKRPIQNVPYDTFLLRDGNFPMTPDSFAANSHFVDVVNGSFARNGRGARSVLTLYWPLPWFQGRYSLYTDESWLEYAERIAPDVRAALALYGLSADSVEQIRFTRWGHPVPICSPRLIADGIVDHLRRPFEGRVYFVNQDNWGLPAVENSLLDAKCFSDQIARDLG